MRRERTLFRTMALLGLASCGLVFRVGIAAADVKITSDTLLRWYEREARRGGKDVTLVPGYEYLQVDLGQTEADGFSFHGYGWGRYNFGETDYFDDRSAGEVMYGYLEYYRSAYKAFGRVGRQAIFSGTSHLALDGARVGSDLTSYFSAEAWVGQPVALEEVNGRTNDLAWGGRLENHYRSLYAVGLSYKRVHDDDAKQQEILAVDSSVTPSFPVTLTGYSSLNQRTEEWQEHSYDLRAYLKQLRLGVLYRKYELSDFAEQGRFTGSPFQYMQYVDVGYTQWGGDVALRQGRKLELGLRYLHLDNDENDDTADRTTLFASLHGGGLTQLGGEFGRQNGDEDETSYWMARIFGYWERGPGFLSGDLVYYAYDEAIQVREDEKKDDSLFISLGVGRRFMNDSLEARIAGDYNTGPYFDSDLRALASMTYKFSR